MAWTNEKQPFGQNRAPLLTGVSTADGITGVPVAVDPATGAIVIEGVAAIKANYTDGTTGAMNDTANHQVIAAPGAGEHLRITSILITNGHATTSTYVVIKDGTTEKKRAFTAFGGGGAMLIFPTPLKLASNSALNAANVTNSSETYVSAEGYIEAD